MLRHKLSVILVLVVCISLVGLATSIVLISPTNQVMPTLAVLNDQNISPTVTYFQRQDITEDLNTNNQYILQYENTLTRTELDDILNNLDARIVDEIPQIQGAVVAFDTPMNTEQLAELSSSFVIEQNYTVQSLQTFPPTDPMTDQQWGLHTFDLAPLWDVSTGAGITVAIIDSGVCFHHPDLQARFRNDGIDYVDDDTDPSDLMGHGCAISGIIGANVNNTIGITGISPNVDILPIRVLDENGAGTYADVIAAIYYAVDADADILNLSLGGQNPSQLLEQAINYAIDNGVDIVAGTGNTGQNGVLYPARYPDVIAVGSRDINGNRSSFSTYGNEVDTLAPGENILTTSLDGGYGYYTGTSMAAPFVSGLLALSKASGQSIDLANIVSTPTPNAVVTEEYMVEALVTATPTQIGENPTNTPIPTPTSDPAILACTHNVTVSDANGLITTLESALASAGDDVICLGGGTYTLTAIHNGDDSWTYNGLPIIDSTIIIKGNDSIIERDGSAPAFRILEVASSGYLTLMDTTIQNGLTEGFGGGINSDGKLLIVNSYFLSNIAFIGGGVHIEAGQASILDSEFRDNIAENDLSNQDSWGGGFHNNGDSIIDGTLFFENQSDRGGGLSNHTDLTITNSRIIRNTATKYGAAITGQTSGSNIVLADSCIYGNTSPSNSGSIIYSYSTAIQAYRNWWGKLAPLILTEERYLIEIDSMRIPILGCLGGDYQEFDVYHGETVDVTLNDATGGVPPYTYSDLQPPFFGFISGTYPSFSITTGGSDELLLYTITDDDGNSADGGVQIYSFPYLQPISDTYTTDWDNPVSLKMSNDGGAPPFSYTNVSSPTGGVLTGEIPNFVYQVTGTYTGSDTITYDVTDKLGATVTNSWTVNLTELELTDSDTVTPFNTGQSLPIVVTGGLPPYDISVIDTVTLGNISGAYPNLVFTPNNNAVGTETITLQATDQIGNIAPAELTLTVCRDSITYHVADGDVQGLRNSINDAQDAICGFVPDVIELAQNGEYLFGDYVDPVPGPSALPLINTNLTINGNGASLIRDELASAFRLLTIAAALDTTIEINNLQIINGYAGPGAYRDAWGGGAYVLGSDADYSRFVTFDGVLFQENNADSRGHALYAGGRNITIKNGAFLNNGNNEAGGSTVFVDNNYWEVLLENNLFYSNGGQTIHNSGYLTLRHNTFWQNDTRNLYASQNSFVANVEGNIFGETGYDSCWGSRIASLGYNISFDNTCDDDLIATGDQFNVPSGVSALIYADDSIIPTVSLLMDSPALDAIPAVDCHVATDVYGTIRPLDSNGDSIAACEIGAFEMSATDFVIQKSADKTNVNVGDDVEYTIIVSNNGPLDADHIHIADVLPEYLQYSSSIATQGAYNSATGLWQIGTLNVGQNATLTLDVVISLPTSGTTITNTALLAGATSGDNNNDYSASVDVDVTCPTSSILTVADGDPGGLITAIQSANNETCNPGTDTIYLATDGEYIFDTIYKELNALPQITSDIIIEGNNAILTRDLLADDMRFRLFQT
jgi:uncharacterized repeat protein (TIGR01451 family)